MLVCAGRQHGAAGRLRHISASTHLIRASRRHLLLPDLDAPRFEKAT